MAFNPTKEQEYAIYGDGSLLVSAAAGSGKTAVLVERVVRLLTASEKPVSADKLLVVTYTNAAAAELRSRIEKRLVEEFEKNPENTFLQRQKILLCNAKICTIDAFCLDFLRENFERAGLSPTFRIADNAELALLEKNAMSALFSECFDSEDKEFLSLLDFLGEDFDDSKLRRCIKTIFDYSRHIPFSDEWISRISDEYYSFADSSDSKWIDSALENVADLAEEAKNYFNSANALLAVCDSAYEKYNKNYIYFSEITESISEKCLNFNWDGIRELLLSLNPPKCKSLTAQEKTEAVTQSIEFRDKGKAVLKSIEKIVYGTETQIRSEVGFCAPYIKKICELVNRYADKLYDSLFSRDMITFYIAEQKVLEMLCYCENGTIVVGDGANKYVQRYEAILVDEYQDTNSLQDTLFDTLSSGGNNLFCVGDMKQCIYKFRGSNPTNFLLKKENAQPFSEAAASDGMRRIDLGCNFRSRAEICIYINSVFSKILYQKNSGFDYDENEMLLPMAVYPENSELKVENHFFDFASVNENDESGFDSKILAEAEFVAGKIEELVSAEPFLREGTNLRKARYSDFAILVRSMREKGEVFIKVLKEKGIPVSAASSEVLESDEGRTLIALLKAINNPTDDISLLTVLTSPLFGFTFNEISEIRAERKYGSLFSAFILASSNGNSKSKGFISTIELLRRKSMLISCGMLIDEIIEQTNMLNLYSLGDRGDTCRKNILSIQNLAFGFENGGSKTLREFLHYLNELSDKDIKVGSEGSDSVKVMTIHKSKGLQFPICILANTANRFNMQDINDSVIVSEKHGFSLVHYDDSGCKQDLNILRSVMRNEAKMDLLAEELRVFYVALTRAEEKLITLSSFDDLNKEIAKADAAIHVSDSENRIEYTLFKHSTSYADWILQTSLLAGEIDPIGFESKNDRVFIHRDVQRFYCVEAKNEEAVEEVISSEMMRKAFAYEYPYAPLLELQSKSSVSDIVHKADEKRFAFSERPSLLQKEKITSAELGTAMHKIMQYIDYETASRSLDTELERLYEYLYLTEAEVEAVNRERLSRFFSSELCRRVLEASFVKKEFRFLNETSACDLGKDIDEQFRDEMIIVQGAVDLLFEENGKINIVDFKTDRCSCEKDLIDAYEQQLKLYAVACSKIFNKPIGELIIYSFTLNKSIIIK